MTLKVADFSVQLIIRPPINLQSIFNHLFTNTLTPSLHSIIQSILRLWSPCHDSAAHHNHTSSHVRRLQSTLSTSPQTTHLFTCQKLYHISHLFRCSHSVHWNDVIDVVLDELIDRLFRNTVSRSEIGSRHAWTTIQPYYLKSVNLRNSVDPDIQLSVFNGTITRVKVEGCLCHGVRNHRRVHSFCTD